MRQLIASAIVLATVGLVSAPPVPMPPQSATVTSFNFKQVDSTSVPTYFELYVTDDNIKWDYVCSSEQLGVTNAPAPVFRIKDDLPWAQHRSFKWLSVSKEKFDNPPPSSGKYGTGICVFLR